MRLKKLAFVAAAIGAVLASTPASASPIVLDQWYTFGFGGSGSNLVNGSGFTQGTNPSSLPAPNSPWTFTLASAGSVTVVDGFLSGDVFTISNFGTAIGTTSTPDFTGTCSSDITACLADPGMSQGTFALAAGSYSLTGTVQSTPFTGGAGFFIVRSTPAVPEPSTWAMMLLGFGAIGYGARRRKRKLALSFS